MRRARPPSLSSWSRTRRRRSSRTSASLSSASRCSCPTRARPRRSSACHEGRGDMDLIWDGLREAFRILGTGDRDGWGASLRSLFISGTATAVALVIGIATGAGLAFRRFPGRNLAVALVNTGMGLPPVVVGLIVAILLWRSVPLGQFQLIYTPAAMVVAQTVLAT